MNWLWLSSLVVILDQVTKQVAEHSLLLHKPMAVFPTLNWTLMYNKGAAFSFLSQAGGWQRWFFIVLSSVISIALVIWLRKLNKSQRVLAGGIALILGGAIGNLVDRVLFGHVIDFVQVYYYAESCLPGFGLSNYSGDWQCMWPAFNVADAAIFLGACLLILDMFLEHKKGYPNG
jgi:signal peptidase II